MKHTASELDKLFTEVGTYRGCQDYSELLDFVRRFRHVAPYNAMLIHIQKPGSIYAASAEEWGRRFGRHPKPGARPLIILRPFGPVGFVYELGDTYGDPFPEALEHPLEATGPVRQNDVDRLVSKMFYAGVSYREENYGADRFGLASIVSMTGTYSTKTNRVCFRVPYAITLREDLTPATKLASIYHELGHILCGHLAPQGIKTIPERSALTEEVCEFEAESVAWLLCERQGIANPSAEYLSDYLGHHDEIPCISVETVLKAVGRIEQIRDGMCAPNKDLVIQGDTVLY